MGESAREPGGSFIASQVTGEMKFRLPVVGNPPLSFFRKWIILLPKKMSHGWRFAAQGLLSSGLPSASCLDLFSQHIYSRVGACGSCKAPCLPSFPGMWRGRTAFGFLYTQPWLTTCWRVELMFIVFSAFLQRSGANRGLKEDLRKTRGLGPVGFTF